MQYKCQMQNFLTRLHQFISFCYARVWLYVCLNRVYNTDAEFEPACCKWGYYRRGGVQSPHSWQVLPRHFVTPDSCERPSKTRDYAVFHNWERKTDNSKCSSHIICSTHIDQHREKYIGCFQGCVWELPFDGSVSILSRDSQQRYFIFLSSASVFFNYIWLTELQTKLGCCYCFGQSAVETQQEAHPRTRQW